MPGKPYVPGDPEIERELEAVKIRPDGSVESSDLISPEQAAKLQERIDRVARGGNPETPPGETPEEKAEREAKEREAEEANLTAEEKEAKRKEREEAEKKAREQAEKVGQELEEEITIGGEKFKIKDLLEEMEKEYGDIDTSTMDPESRMSMLEAFIDHKHKGAWQRSQTRTAQELAEEKRRLAAEQERVATQQEELKARRAQLLAKEADLSSKLEGIDRDIESLREIAAKQITIEQTKDEDGNPIPDKFEEYLEAKQARKRLADLEKAKETVGQEAQVASRNRIVADVEVFMATHAEYAMSEPLSVVIRKIEQEKQFDHPDRDKLLDIYEILDCARDHTIPMEVAYQRLQKKGQLTVKLEKPPAPTTSVKQSERERLAAAVASKQKGAAFVDTTGQRTTRPQLPKKSSLGDIMREHSRRALSGGNNEALDKLGY